MTGNDYQTLAMRTSNKDLSDNSHLLNGALGLSGEAGEVSDLVKKVFFQGHKLDTAHLAKELGDVLWYVAETATAIGYNLDDIMQMNIDKLRERYPDGFDPARSTNRKEGDI
jgi:NTP pyrophosphatase (non-canonical NTP hydrolase)